MSETSGDARMNRDDLKSVAQFQKGILVCILIQLLVMAGQFMVPPQLKMIVGAGVIVAGCAGTVFVFLLATKIYSTGVGVVLGVLTLIPCVGLIVLLIVNSKATGTLQQNGIKVGLLGANSTQI